METVLPMEIAVNNVLRPDSVLRPGSATRWSRRMVLGAGLSACAFRTGADEAGTRAAIRADFDATVLEPGRIEIAMPEFSDSGKSVPMEIFVPSDMTPDDYPRVVRVYAPRNPRPRVVALYFTPACGEARMSTRVRLGSFQDVVAIAEMSDGKTFEAIRRVNVTYGACEDAMANDQFPPGWAPSIRVATPQSAAAGELFTVRTIINHPMETGLRRDKSGLLVPVRIADRFTCRANGQEVFGAKLEPAISANPYIAFSLRLEQSAELAFEWIDTNGERYEHTARVEVV
jgi:sulfur-oxidizing protein SoxY